MTLSKKKSHKRLQAKRLMGTRIRNFKDLLKEAGVSMEGKEGVKMETEVYVL